MPCVEKADVTIDLEICILKLPDLNHARLAYQGIFMVFLIFISWEALICGNIAYKLLTFLRKLFAPTSDMMVPMQSTNHCTFQGGVLSYFVGQPLNEVEWGLNLSIYLLLAAGPYNLTLYIYCLLLLHSSSISMFVHVFYFTFYLRWVGFSCSIQCDLVQTTYWWLAVSAASGTYTCLYSGFPVI